MSLLAGGVVRSVAAAVRELSAGCHRCRPFRRGWCEVLGDPAVRCVRNALILSWLAALALFSSAEEWW
jgi:hypothetical protein